MTEQLNFRRLNANETELLDQQTERSKLRSELKLAPYTSIYVEYTTQGNLTIATIYYAMMLFVGASKRSPLDKEVETIGKNIAFCRALNSEPISLP